jgi:hypothetical protein
MKIIFKPHELDLVKKIYIAIGRDTEVIDIIAAGKGKIVKTEKELALEVEQETKKIKDKKVKGVNK